MPQRQPLLSCGRRTGATHEAPPGARRLCDSEGPCRSRTSNTTTAACRWSTQRGRICATRFARSAGIRDSPRRPCLRSASASARRRRCSPSSKRCCCGLSPMRSRSVSSGSSRPIRIKHWTKNVAAPANYADWKAQNTVFEEVAAYEAFSKDGSGASDVYLTGSGEPQGLKALVVSGNLIRMLGVPPLMGRMFTDEETFDGKARVVVLSYGLWQSLYGGDPAAIGRTMMLNGRMYDVVGVMPPGFAFPGRDVQLWMPLAYAPSLFTTARRPHWLRVVARLRADVSLDRARQDMTAIAGRLERQYPDTNTQMGVLLEPFHESLNGEQRPALLMLFSAVGVLFLIVCANIANLQFGRAVSRTREMAIRHALGAGRRRLVRQLLTESLLLSTIGGAAGSRAGGIGADGARRAGRRTHCRSSRRCELDRTVLLFAAGLCLGAPVAFGLIPALTASRTRSAERSQRIVVAANAIDARRSGRLRGRAVGRAGGRRCAARPQPHPSAGRRSRIQSGARRHVHRLAAGRTLSRRCETLRRLRRDRAPAARQPLGAGGRRRQHARTARLHVDRRLYGRRPRADRLRTRAAPRVDHARTTSARSAGVWSRGG